MQAIKANSRYPARRINIVMAEKQKMVSSMDDEIEMEEVFVVDENGLSYRLPSYESSTV